jgi:uracil-DNA glycosylase
VTTTSLVFVGESPPAGAPADFTPFDCASGSRLAAILGLLDKATLLSYVPRDNIFAQPTGVDGAPAWNFERSMQGAEDVIERAGQRSTLIALGRRVADAFLVRHPIPKMAPTIGQSWSIDASWRTVRCIYAPHPSGRSSIYASGDVARHVRQMLLPELILGVPSLRPWHFRLDDPAVLQDLAGAVSPVCPALGAAALTWAAGQHKALQLRLSTPLLASIHAATNRLLEIPAAPWDAPLAYITRACVQHDGARILGAKWDPARVARKAGHAGWLALMAKNFADLNNISRHLARGTLARYAEAGIT